MRKVLLAAVGACVFAATCLPYLACSRYGLCACDDFSYVCTHRQVMDGLSLAGVRWAFVHLEDAIWMPLTWMSYMADYTFFGGSPGAMHVHSFVVHGLNAVLLWLLLLRLVRRTDAARGAAGAVAAAVAALVWSLHPLRVESVTWIASRKDVLSMFFLLAALHGWLGFRAAAGRGARWCRYALSLAALAVGAMCKPSVMVFPGLALVLDWLVLGKIALVIRNGRPALREPKAALPLIAPFALGVLIALEGAVAQRVGGALGVSGMPLAGQLVNMVAAFGLYVWNTVCPFALGIDCVPKWPTLPRGLFAFGIPAVALACWCFWACWRRLVRDGGAVRVPAWGLAGAVWFCGALVPFMANFGIHVQADRFTYIPAVGLSLAILGLLCAFPARRGVSLAAGLALAGALGVQTWRQNAFWRDDRTLYEHTLAVDGENNDRAHGILGVWWWNDVHDLERAVAHLERAATLKRDWIIDVDHVRVFALAESGRIAEAGKVLWEMKVRYRDQREKLEKKGSFSTATTLPLQIQQANAAYFMAQTNMMKAAGMELAEIPAEHTNDVVTLYLKGRFAWLQGRKDEAAAIWREMCARAGTTEYLDCAFVKQYLDAYAAEQKGKSLK